MERDKVGHVTPAGANLFLELGFAPEEAEAMRAELHREAEATLTLKRQLMDEITAWIAQNGLKQAQAAQVLQVSRPRVSDVVNHKAGKFTIDTLVNMLTRTGRRVELSVRPG